MSGDTRKLARLLRLRQRREQQRLRKLQVARSEHADQRARLHTVEEMRHEYLDQYPSLTGSGSAASLSRYARFLTQLQEVTALQALEEKRTAAVVEVASARYLQARVDSRSLAVIKQNREAHHKSQQQRRERRTQTVKRRGLF